MINNSLVDVITDMSVIIRYFTRFQRGLVDVNYGRKIVEYVIISARYRVPTNPRESYIERYHLLAQNDMFFVIA